MTTQSLLFSSSQRFGLFIFQQKVRVLSLLFLSIPVAALVFSIWRPAFVDLIFASFCHQNAERSFTLDGNSLPLCARCLGLYLGFGLAGLFWAVFSRTLSRRLLLFAVLLSLGIFVLRFVFPVFDANLIRLFSGLGVGGGLVIFLKSYLKR